MHLSHIYQIICRYIIRKITYDKAILKTKKYSYIQWTEVAYKIQIQAIKWNKMPLINMGLCVAGWI